MSKTKFGHKLGGSFAPLLTHTTKSPAWSMLCVGARALFGHLQGRYYQDREGYVFLSARDGAKELRTKGQYRSLARRAYALRLPGHAVRPSFRGRWRRTVGTLSRHGSVGSRTSPTRDFDKWSGEIFRPEKRVYSHAEKARLNELKKQNPVLRSRTPRPTVGDIRTSVKKPLKGTSVRRSGT